MDAPTVQNLDSPLPVKRTASMYVQHENDENVQMQAEDKQDFVGSVAPLAR